MTSTAPILTAEAFTAWLEGQTEGGIVGAACSTQFCPLAEYLRDSGAPRPAVGDLAYLLDTRGDSADIYMLPDWAKAFIGMVDETLAAAICTTVTAGAALEIMTRVMKGAA